MFLNVSDSRHINILKIVANLLQANEWRLTLFHVNKSMISASLK